MKVIIDTNVGIVANQIESPQASPNCIAQCASRLLEIQRNGTIIIDNGWQILQEYMNKLDSSGQPGPGDAFLKWVLTNQANTRWCEQVSITPLHNDVTHRVFEEIPDDPALRGFDRSDQKFVAVAIAHPEHPPILNAVDTDWADYEIALQQHGVQVIQLCRDDINRLLAGRA